MKAAIRESYGPPSVLEIKKVEIPLPDSKEILVRVHAATVNRSDCALLWGQPLVMRLIAGLSKPKLKTTGTDFAGVVAAVGPQVKDFKIGDKVWGFNDNGLCSHAEFLTINPIKRVAQMPEGIEFEEAAASIEGAHYAINFLNKVTINPTDRILINGVTGAIGSAMLQMCKAKKNHVTAVGNTKNIALIKSLGADQIIDYEKQDFTQVSDQYDFVFDAVGKSCFAKCKKILKKGGIYISSELGPGNENLYLPLTTKIWGKHEVRFPFPSNLLNSLAIVKEHLDAKVFKPVIEKRYALTEIQEAFTYVASGQKTGNVVIKM